MCYRCEDNDFGSLDPTVYCTGRIKLDREFAYHEHDFTELVYVLSGKGRYLIDGELYDAAAGDLIVLNSGVKHKNIVVEGEEPITEFFIGFSDFHISKMKPNMIAVPENGYIVKLSVEGKREMLTKCYDILAEKETQKIGRDMMQKAYLMQMVVVLLREIRENACSNNLSCNIESYNKKNLVKNIIVYLNKNYGNKISLDSIAQNMYLSPVYISKIFKEETGESPINYLIKIRLERAKDMLEYSFGSSIKSISSEVGYDDVYHFSKLFKKYYGVSPQHYRKTLLQKNA